MILHSVTIRDWKNIGRLTLDALGAPLVVLHGPNRTGKSSIVEAIRCCLFDYDHDSTAAPIAGAAPWPTKATPEISIEFETEGRRYRLMKRFSKRKDGAALLEQLSTTGEATVLERGKEAAREARRILSGEKSEEGLNQLLWLPQGRTTLPEPSKLDPNLRKRFESVLGSMLTSQDIDFHDLLLEQCKQYFSPKTGKELKKSPTIRLRDETATLENETRELQDRVRESESLVREYDQLQAELDEVRTQLELSQSEIEKLSTANEAAQSKREALRQARQTLAAAESQAAEAKRRFDKHAELNEELSALETQMRSVDNDLGAAEQSRSEHESDLARREEELSQLREESSQIEQQGVELDDKRRLLDIAEECAAAERVVDECAELEQRLRDQRKKLEQLITADEKTQQQLRRNRRDAAKLQADIDAAALRLEIEPTDGGRIQLAIDEQPPADVELAGETRMWQFRQRMELISESFGTIRILRGEADLSLDDAVRKLDRLNREFADRLAGFAIDADDEAWIEKLVERRQKSDSITGDIRDAETRIAELAPEGVEVLRSAISRLQAERSGIVERSPALVEWHPDAAEWKNAKSEHEARRNALRTREQELAGQIAEARKRHQKANERLQDCRIKAAEFKQKSTDLTSRLEELGNAFTLEKNLNAANEQLAQAAKRVEESALSPEEEQLETRLEQEQAALAHREARLRETEKHAHGIKERLKERAGLHEALAEAEANHQRVRAQLAREELNMSAHRLLLETFESCREEKVRRTVGPIEDQVLGWTSRLGLAEYHAVDFGAEDYLPTGFKPHAAESIVAIDDESFGTIEQIALLIRLAAGRLLAKDEPHVAILDDPLTHADRAKHRAMLDILEEVTRDVPGEEESPFAPLQLLIFTCHPRRFDHLRNAVQVDLVNRIERHLPKS